MEMSDIEKAHLDIERERLQLEKAQAEINKRFLRTNSGVLISAAVSLAAVTVSLSQVWVTKIQKDKELEIATIQRKSEMEIQEKQKERELTAQDAQKKREWDLSAAKFITDNRKAIFNGTQVEQKLFAKLIGSIYPPDVSSSLLERIENASPTASKQTWREIRSAIQQPRKEPTSATNEVKQPLLGESLTNGLKLSPDRKYYMVVRNGGVSLFDASTNKELRRIVGNDDEIIGAFFSPDGNLILTVTISGKRRTWNIKTGQVVQ